MPTIEETVDAFELDPNAAQRLKTWLTSVDVGYNLGDAPDMGFYALSDEQLQKAGLSTVRQRNLVLAKLNAPTGELGVSSAPFLQIARAQVQIFGVIIQRFCSKLQEFHVSQPQRSLACASVHRPVRCGKSQACQSTAVQACASKVKAMSLSLWSVAHEACNLLIGDD